MLRVTNPDPLHKSESHTEQCSRWSLNTEHASRLAPCLLHDLVICLTSPPTIIGTNYQINLLLFNNSLRFVTLFKQTALIPSAVSAVVGSEQSYIFLRK